MPEGRDGPLVDWVKSLYNEVAIAKYADERDLLRKLENRLRELASGQESLWIKLGALVVPGTVTTVGSRGAVTYEIHTRVRDGQVRRAMTELATGYARRSDRLTWGMTSVPIDRVDVATQSTRASADDVTITCHHAANAPRAGWGGMTSTINEGTMSFGPADQALMWAERAVFGKQPAAHHARSLVHSMTTPDGPTLPSLLTSVQAREWLAEGITRLYLVEGLLTKYGGHFNRLDVGPATATGVRVFAEFVVDSVQPQSIEISGIVVLHS